MRERTGAHPTRAAMMATRTARPGALHVTQIRSHGPGLAEIWRGLARRQALVVAWRARRGSAAAPIPLGQAIGFHRLLPPASVPLCVAMRWGMDAERVPRPRPGLWGPVLARRAAGVRGGR